MGKLKVVSSCSDGNCYIITCGKDVIIIDVGVKWEKILKALDYDLSLSPSVLVSHKHLDHSKSIEKALHHQLNVYSCQEVVDVHPKVKKLEIGKKRRINNFVVQPIPLEHNCECYGYLIEHEDMGRLVFATDTSSFPYKMKNIHHFLIEANYSDEYIIDNICDNEESRSRSVNHLELQDTIEAIERNYSCDLQNVVLIHLSKSNSNAFEFVKNIERVCPYTSVFVATPDFELPLNKEAF